MIDEITEKLKNGDKYCLQFDGKRLEGVEYQVFLLTNSTEEIKLGISKCNTGSASDIYEELKNTIEKYDAWKNITMIICDTTNVNTGKTNGVVSLLQQKFNQEGYTEPQYIGCQHHILDLVIMHILKFSFQDVSKGPNLPYRFISQIQKDYNSLKQEYERKASSELQIHDNPGWRDDFRFLYELCQAFRSFKSSRIFPKIKWKSLPPMNNARWNSKAIYCIIGFFLLPNWREKLGKLCEFICYEWADAWFSDQRYNELSYNSLLSSLDKIGSVKAINSLRRNWSEENSRIDIPRTNQVAERAVKRMAEIYLMTIKKELMSYKFIIENKIY